VQLLGSGTILREVIAGANLLEQDFGIVADIWSATSFSQLRRDGIETQRWNMLHPESEPRLSHLENCLKDRDARDRRHRLHEAVRDQVRGQLPARHFHALARRFRPFRYARKLRRFFEVDRNYVAVAR